MLSYQQTPQQGYPGYPQQQPQSGSIYPQLPGMPNQLSTSVYGAGYAPGIPGGAAVGQPQQAGQRDPFTSHLPHLPHLPHLSNPFHHQQQPQGLQGVPGLPGVPGQGPAPSPFGAGQTMSGWNRGPSYVGVAPQGQPLEVVSKDEDPMYGPLGRARGKIERGFVMDNEISPDVADQLAVTTTEPYIPSPTQTAAYRVARVVRNTPLPDALHQELNFKHLTAKMGLFEEIDRAWFAVDSRLFLWDYTDGRDFSRYDQQAETIQAVGLVRARKEVFVDDISHVLIICTATKLTLLGLSRSDKGEISLYATNMTVDLPTGIIDIKGTDAGRVFLLGLNKELYELEYSTSTGWLGGGSRAWVSNRSSGYIGSWVPAVFSFNDRNGIEQFTIDPQQSRLFTLHTQGEVEWVDISDKKYEPRAKYSTLKSDFQRSGYGGQAPQYAGAKIVSIAAIPSNESKKAWLVAISASGARIYLGAYSYYGSMNSGLQVVGHRPPPPDCQKAEPVSFYSSGTFISARFQDGSSPTTKLTIVAPAAGRISSLRENFDSNAPGMLQEYVSVEVVSNMLWALAEVTSTDPARSPSSLRRPDGIGLSALPRQTTAGARRFLALTTSGLFIIEQPRPIDMLQEDIELEKDQAITVARNTFGRVQLASMGIQMGVYEDRKQADLATAAVNILLSADPPLIQTGASGNRTIIYSPRHDGLALILSRLLRPIWSSKVCANNGGRLVLGVSDKTLVDVQGRLSALQRYLDEHPFPRHQAENDAKIAWEQEELSVHGLFTLLKQSIEAISFVLLLSDYKVSDVIAKCDQRTQQALVSMTFQGLLTSLAGRDIARKLVTALIELQIGQEVGIDSLSAVLQQRCGNFVQSGDVVLYKAEECLRRAENTRDPSERADNVSESLRLFSRAASTAASAVFQRLPDAVRRYRVLDDVRGTIELPLRVATDLDPNEKALDYVRDGENPGDPRRAFLEQRWECYQLVVDALHSYDEQLNKATAKDADSDINRIRDEAYGLCLASPDELFQFYFYDWTSSIGRAEQLLDIDTPFIESYLQKTANNIPNLRDLLWKYYARREEYLAAARALYDLAVRPSDMLLPTRVYYLAQALTNAQSAASIGDEDVEFTTGLQERIDVAQVQLEVVRAVEGHPDMSPAEKVEPLERLNAELLNLDELYNYARPLRLLECILLILKTADMRVVEVLDAVWKQLIINRGARSSPFDAGVGELVTDLCRKFYPSEAAPTDIVLPVVYEEAAPHRLDSRPGWASEALLNGGVPLRDLWDAVVGMHDEASADLRDYFAEEAAALIKRWIDTKDVESHGLPAADVETFASAYLLRTQGPGAQAGQRIGETRKIMQQGKAAAAKF